MEGDLKMKTASSSSSSSFDRYRGRPRSDGWKAAELRADEWVVGARLYCENGTYVLSTFIYPSSKPKAKKHKAT